MAHAEHGADCCSTCNCLAYCATQNPFKSHRPSLGVLTHRKFRDFELSAKRGCHFCDLALQSFLVLPKFEGQDPEVDVLFYPDSPTEIHLVGDRDASNVVEIYPESAGDTFYSELTHDVAREPTLRTAIDFLRENYYVCRTEHLGCEKVVPSLPKRVVDISQSRYRLEEPQEGSEARYATLSYSWGTRGFPMTTLKTYEGLKNGFSKERLPIAFQEAAEIARSLDIRYIWIDSLCIIQDDAAEWEDQAAKMGNIYQAATISIAASSSVDPYESLFKKRSSMHESFELQCHNSTGRANAAFRARRKISRGTHAKTGRSQEVDHLDTRAWGLQEKLLATRTIAFTDSELQWTCQTSKMCECRTKSYTNTSVFSSITAANDSKGHLANSKLWARVVEAYSARDLTYREDKLPALSGLAKKYQEMTGYTYVAGLWHETIWYDLVWQCDATAQKLSRSKAVSMHTEALEACLGPTYSWASVDSAVNYRMARHSYPGTRIFHASLVDHLSKTLKHEKLSKPPKAFLMINGHITRGSLQLSQEEPRKYELCIADAVYPQNADRREICEFSIDTISAPYSETEGERSSNCIPSNGSHRRSKHPVILISLYSIHHQNYLYQNFLIAKRSAHNADTYERVGIGSGKLYSTHDLPDQPDLVRPFEWLSVDLARRGSSEERVANQVTCLL